MFTTTFFVPYTWMGVSSPMEVLYLPEHLVSVHEQNRQLSFTSSTRWWIQFSLIPGPEKEETREPESWFSTLSTLAGTGDRGISHRIPASWRDHQWWGRSKNEGMNRLNKLLSGWPGAVPTRQGRRHSLYSEVASLHTRAAHESGEDETSRTEWFFATSEDITYPVQAVRQFPVYSTTISVGGVYYIDYRYWWHRLQLDREIFRFQEQPGFFSISAASLVQKAHPCLPILPFLFLGFHLQPKLGLQPIQATPPNFASVFAFSCFQRLLSCCRCRSMSQIFPLHFCSADSICHAAPQIPQLCGQSIPIPY